MKIIKQLLFSLLLLGVCQVVVSQVQSVGIPNEVISALNSGDAETLSKHLNDNVELVVGTKNNVYSKRQAQGILEDFFKKNHPARFKVLHSGNKKATSFLIGTLETSSGNYRVYLLTRKSNNKPVIQQIRIEKE